MKPRDVVLQRKGSKRCLHYLVMDREGRNAYCCKCHKEFRKVCKGIWAQRVRFAKIAA